MSARAISQATRTPASRREADLAASVSGVAPAGSEPAACYHCGTPCGAEREARAGRAFCCAGCATVYELLCENDLGHFYDLGRQAGLRASGRVGPESFRYLDDPTVRERLLDFSDGRVARVTFTVPAMHCIACVWLLENLFRLREGIGRSAVNFPRKQVAITFDETRLRLSEVVALLDSIGYPPTLRLDTVERGNEPATASRRLYLQLGVAGFAFGNAMLFSFPAYLGLTVGEEPGLRFFFGVLSLALAVPVLGFSAADYWRSAWTALRRGWLTIELPIAMGLAALFGQSAYEILSRTGEGYVDSLTGLVFFLLCGRVFQQKTYARLAFDRDYRSFFPLSVVRRQGGGEEMVAISRLAVGDRLRLRHGELLPADARLVSGEAWLDYSFVTGESDPVARHAGDHLYAGGLQVGGEIEVETVKPVSQSYLASLWDHEAFRKTRADSLDTLTNRFSRWFTLAVVGIALGAAAWWLPKDLGTAIRAFTSVLIVACPCALALSAPFALGAAQRLLAGAGIFVRNPQVIETLARLRTIVFDKTGTLTVPRTGEVRFDGPPLSREDAAAVRALARQSTHPYAVRIGALLGRAGERPRVHGFREVPGQGIEGTVAGRRIRLGAVRWVSPGKAPEGGRVLAAGSEVGLAVDARLLGVFRLQSAVRAEVPGLVGALRERYDLALVSGDNDRDRERLAPVFGGASLRFNQTPLDKLEFVRALQAKGGPVMMVGDGLNDAGAFRQSDVGVAVTESLGAFSPASDVILEGTRLGRLPEVLAIGRSTVRVVRLCILLSCAYNVAGVSFAARGLLAPWLCAVLMPVSSISVVLLAVGATRWGARRRGLSAEAPGLEEAT
ncbi:MAG: heavy metal translocating P-type ATPase metal-binding domain-containing protein [Verrucomicrobiales bacterium]|nr:heavy metal translocating P-type ATPase metal-binding domain-containing protein [Verrucomicrobiales bacterium]